MHPYLFGTTVIGEAVAAETYKVYTRLQTTTYLVQAVEAPLAKPSLAQKLVPATAVSGLHTPQS